MGYLFKIIWSLRLCGETIFFNQEQKQNKEMKMQTIKQEAIDAISKMPEQTNMDEIMYRLYVIDKIKKGREAAGRGDVTSIDELRKEIEQWWNGPDRQNVI